MRRTQRSRAPRRAKRFAKNARTGRVQRTLSTATAASATAIGIEIYFEHYRGSFGNRWMWTPIVLAPTLAAAGVAGAVSERAATTVLPIAAGAFAFDGLIGIFTHARGVMRKPGGLSEPLYNIVMGPPLLAPGSLVLIGGVGVLASVLPRER